MILLRLHSLFILSLLDLLHEGQIRLAIESKLVSLNPLLQS